MSLPLELQQKVDALGPEAAAVVQEIIAHFTQEPTHKRPKLDLGPVIATIEESFLLPIRKRTALNIHAQHIQLGEMVMEQQEISDIFRLETQKGWNFVILGSGDYIKENAVCFACKSKEIAQLSSLGSIVTSEFRSSSGTQYVACHYKAKEGFLYFMPCGLLFGFKKPLMYFKYNEWKLHVNTVVKHTFNLCLQRNDQEIEFQMISQLEYEGIAPFTQQEIPKPVLNEEDSEDHSYHSQDESSDEEDEDDGVDEDGDENEDERSESLDSASDEEQSTLREDQKEDLKTEQESENDNEEDELDDF